MPQAFDLFYRRLDFGKEFKQFACGPIAEVKKCGFESGSTRFPVGSQHSVGSSPEEGGMARSEKARGVNPRILET